VSHGRRETSLFPALLYASGLKPSLATTLAKVSRRVLVTLALGVCWGKLGKLGQVLELTSKLSGAAGLGTDLGDRWGVSGALASAWDAWDLRMLLQAERWDML